MEGPVQRIPGYRNAEVLASGDWLAAHLGDRAVRIVDARFDVRPASKGSFQAVPGRESYEAGHIPGAVFVDVAADLKDSNDPVHVVSPERFEELMQRLGIGNDTTVVVYDQRGGLWGARLWWALRFYGHDDAKLLSGGLNRWTAEGRPLEPRACSPPAASFRARVRPELRATRGDVLQALERSDACILDALPEPFFEGKACLYPTHRPGHVPTAHNVPAPAHLDPTTDMLLPPRDLERLWRPLRLEPGKKVITYCGAGTFASFAFFALYLQGHENVAVYDGSWREWGADPSLPVAMGPANGSADTRTRR